MHQLPRPLPASTPASTADRGDGQGDVGTQRPVSSSVMDTESDSGRGVTPNLNRRGSRDVDTTSQDSDLAKIDLILQVSTQKIW